MYLNARQLDYYFFKFFLKKLGFSFLNLKRVSKAWKKLIEEMVDLFQLRSSVEELQDFNIEEFELKPLSGGMTNDSYQLRVSNLFFFLRRPKSTIPHYIDRRYEKYNALQASRLGLNVPIYFFDKKGLELTKYLPEYRPLNTEDLNDEEALSFVADTLKILHHSPKFENSVNFNDYLELPAHIELANHCQNLAIDTSSIESLKKQIKEILRLRARYTIPLVPCHNDTTPANFLFFKRAITKPLYLIDLEYSANNDFLWDLVYFAILGNLNQEKMNYLCQKYFGREIDTEILDWIELYKPLVSFWVMIWSFVQIANKSALDAPEAYSNLAKEYLAITLQFINSDNLKLAMQHIESAANESNLRGFDKLVPPNL